MVNRSAEPAVVFSHCPRCGARGLDREASFGFVCRSCSFLFFLNVAAAVAAIIRDPAGRVLLTRRAHDPSRGKLDVPGGFVDHGETAEQALRREIREELSLEIDDLAYFATVPNVYEYAGLNYRTLDVYFTAQPRDLSTLRPADDIDACTFVAPDGIDERDLGFDSVKTILARLRSAG